MIHQQYKQCKKPKNINKTLLHLKNTGNTHFSSYSYSFSFKECRDIASSKPMTNLAYKNLKMALPNVTISMNEM